MAPAQGTTKAPTTIDFRGSIAWLSGSPPTYHDVGCPSPRKAGFQVLAKLSWAGFHPQGSYKRFSTHFMCVGLLFQASWHNPCTVLVLDPPTLLNGRGFVAALRRAVPSERFVEGFGQINWPEEYGPDDAIGKMIPLPGRRMSGRRTIRIRDRNGRDHECLAEAFTQKHQVFVLIWPIRALTTTRVVVPAC